MPKPPNQWTAPSALSAIVNHAEHLATGIPRNESPSKVFQPVGGHPVLVTFTSATTAHAAFGGREHEGASDTLVHLRVRLQASAHFTLQDGAWRVEEEGFQGVWARREGGHRAKDPSPTMVAACRRALTAAMALVPHDDPLLRVAETTRYLNNLRASARNVTWAAQSIKSEPEKTGNLRPEAVFLLDLQAVANARGILPDPINHIALEIPGTDEDQAPTHLTVGGSP